MSLQSTVYISLVCFCAASIFKSPHVFVFLLGHELQCDHVQCTTVAWSDVI